MQLNELRPAAGSTRKRKRVGRGTGSGWGKTCGTGHKGQKSRSGGTVKPGFEGGQMPLQMRLPKYGFSSRVVRITAEIRSGELNKIEGDMVDLATLRKAGLITASIKRAKIMFSGEVKKKLTVKGVGVSKGAREAIENAGGEVIEYLPKEKCANQDPNADVEHSVTNDEAALDKEASKATELPIKQGEA